MDEFRFLPVGLLHESPLNPRRHWNAAAFADLVASIRQQGVLTPLLARPSRTREGHFELAAGHRRLRAAIEALIPDVPVRVREMDDVTFLEVLTIENLQREDVHPLDEADGYQALLDLDGACTPEVLAAKVGKSKSYIYQRLKLRSLTPTVRDAFLRDDLTAAHAIRLARLSPEDQQRAMDDVIYYGLLSGDAGALSLSLAPVTELDDWIRREVRLDLAAPETAELFPEVAKAVEEAQLAGATVLQLSREWTAPAKKTGGPIPAGQWREASGRGEKCKHAQTGVVVMGYDAGTVLTVCVTKACTKHFPPKDAPIEATPEQKRAHEEARRKEQQRWAREDARRKLWQTSVRDEAFAALAAAVGTAPVTRDIVTLVLNELLHLPEARKGVLKALGGAVTSDNLGAALVLACGARGSWDYTSFIDSGIPKTYGIDVRAMLTRAEKSKASTKKVSKRRKAA